MGTDERAAWNEQRSRAIAEHAAAQERVKRAEAERARQLIADFTAEARRRGVPTTPLTACAYNGRTRYRTNLRGWYLRTDRSIAVDSDGNFYVLTVPASLRARFVGAVVQPEDPRLVIGEGARDGESMPLQVLLAQRLDAGDRWPTS
ncbi:MAG TPA: hypothetical protein VK453_04745 [Micromonosporaceae bacterium]|nr:hypothetical protein [Micromonosporaceae bacterium]